MLCFYKTNWYDGMWILQISEYFYDIEVDCIYYNLQGNILIHVSTVAQSEKVFFFYYLIKKVKQNGEIKINRV